MSSYARALGNEPEPYYYVLSFGNYNEDLLLDDFKLNWTLVTSDSVTDDEDGPD